MYTYYEFKQENLLNFRTERISRYRRQVEIYRVSLIALPMVSAHCSLRSVFLAAQCALQTERESDQDDAFNQPVICAPGTSQIRSGPYNPAGV